MAQICSSRFGNASLFFNQITMETVQKGRGVGGVEGHGRSVER